MSDATKSESPEVPTTQQRLEALPVLIVMLTSYLTSTFSAADGVAKRTLKAISAFRAAQPNPRAMLVLHNLDSGLRHGMLGVLNDLCECHEWMTALLHRAVESESAGVIAVTEKILHRTEHMLVRLGATVSLYEKLAHVPRARFSSSDEHRLIYAIGRDFSLLRSITRKLLTMLARELDGEAADCVLQCMRERTRESLQWERVPSPDVEPWPLDLHRERMPDFVECEEIELEPTAYMVLSRNYVEAEEVGVVETICDAMAPLLRTQHARPAANSN